ncbi:MAG: signal peptidase II [Planktomarina sp.]|nr:signal peptidase II [Planktomarina sp.]|tara:strand:+ start:1080 stop:1553 length:474 start_codon:yes stop_codon:yes gene_type:complete
MKKTIIWSATICFILDQLSKWIVVQWLDLLTLESISVIPGFIRFHMAWNTGINFGLFANNGEIARWVLIAVAVLMSGFIAFWMRREVRTIALISAGLVIGGAVGNAIDRLIYGGVADFLNVTCCGIRNPFSFNVADIAIFLGLLGIIFFATDSKKES